MPLSFYDCASGEKIGSTILAKNVLAAATENVDSNLHAKILALKNWRKQYQIVYRDLAQTEFFQEQNLLQIRCEMNRGEQFLRLLKPVGLAASR